MHKLINLIYYHIYVSMISIHMIICEDIAHIYARFQ